MIKVKFFTTDSGNIVGFEVCGHSDYAREGEDIVWAAVSSAAYLTANTITDFMMVDADVCVDDKSGYMKIIISKEKCSLCNDILRGLKAHLLLLEEIYSKDIKVSYAEV